MVNKYLRDMGWLGLAILSKMNYSALLVNEFYLGIVLYAKEYENPMIFDENVIYTFFDGKECVLEEEDLGKLLGCEHYTSPHKAPDHYPADNV